MDKCLVDLGWEQNLVCFIIDGFSGGSAEAKEGTEAIAEAIKEEIGNDFTMPIMIKGLLQ